MQSHDLALFIRSTSSAVEATLLKKNIATAISCQLDKIN
jgi:hypothetical protein